MDNHATKQPSQNAEPTDGGDVLVLTLCVAYIVAAMAASVYLTCDGEARMGLSSFIALWLRELVLLVLVAVGLFLVAMGKVSNAIDTWLRAREKREAVR